MLVLSRKQGESIDFPELKIVVRVVQLKKSKVQLGIEAPREIRVDRSEKVPKRKENEEESASAENKSCCDGGNECDPLFAQHLQDELAKLEAEVAAMAGLVASRDRGLARQMAAISIERLSGLRRAIRFSMQRGEVRPIADYLQLRGELLEQAGSKSRVDQVQADKVWGQTASNNTKCVRQPSAEYFTGASQRASAMSHSA